MQIAMWVFGLLTLVSACGVVASRKTLNSALCLVATLFFVAANFAILGADFLAAIQILVYAGAIMILVVFVIMLLGLKLDADRQRFRGANVISAISVGLLFFMFAYVIHDAGFGNTLQQRLSTSEISEAEFVPSWELQGKSDPKATPDSGAAAVGKLMLTKYLFPFELAALLLLAAIIGAVNLAYEPRRPLRPGRGLSAVRNDGDGAGESIKVNT